MKNTKSTKPESSPAKYRPWQSRFFARFVVKYRLQYKFALYILFLLESATVGFWLLSQHPLLRLNEKGIISDFSTIEVLQVYLKQMVIIGTISGAVLFFISLIISNWVAGPIYRFERVFEEIAKGNIAMRVRIRKHDELQETADLLNEALAQLRERLKEERHQTVECLEQVHDALSSRSPTTIKKAVEAVKSHIKKLKNSGNKIATQ